jgi:hypothetical protein
MKHTMNILGGNGDTAVAYDPAVTEETEETRRKFDDLIKNGYTGFTATKDGKQTGTQIREFDPEAEQIVMVRPLQGG